MWEFLDEYYRRQKIDVNKAPEDIVGDYTLSIKDNRITLRDKDGVEVFARCHPEDVFDVGEGVREAFDKLKEKRTEKDKIEVGDWVKVVDSGQSYTTYADFFTINNVPIDFCIKYRYGEVIEQGTVAKVVFIADNNALLQCNFKDNLGFIFSEAIYLVDLSGLKKVGAE